MRVTHQQLYQPLLIGARDSASRVQDIRSKIASGKKVNTTSDDPLAARRIMRFQEKINNIDQFLVNVRDAGIVLKNEAAFLEDVSDNILRARELTIQAANGYMSQSELDAIAEEINGVIESVLEDSNGRNIDDFVFAGNKSNVKPFVPTIVDGEITAVTYNGDLNITNFQINEGVDFKVKKSGQKIFMDSKAGSETNNLTFSGNLDRNTSIGENIKESVAVFDAKGNIHTLDLTFTKNGDDEYSVAVSSNETGVTFFDSVMESITFASTVTGSFISHGDNDSDSDSNPDIIVDFGMGSQVLNFNFNSISQISEGVKISLDSKDGKVGGYGVFDALISLRDAMRNKDNLSKNGQLKEIAEMLAPLDLVSDHLFESISEFGSKINRLETTERRLEDLKIRVDVLRSSDEDADIVSLVSELTSQEAVFQATLSSGARISRFSLLNFL